MERRYKIGILTSFDAMDKAKLSGITYYMVRIIQKYVGDVELLGPVRRRRILRGVYNRVAKFFPRPYNIDHSLYLAIRYRLIFRKKLKNKQYDFIFVPRGSTEIALLNTDIPLVYLSDTTFRSLYGYYEWFSDFMKLSKWEGNLIERLALKRASAVMMASEWAASSAIEDYGIAEDKVFVAPFSPNMEENQVLPIGEVHRAIISKPRDVCSLLFIGVEWYRKGGDYAYAAMRSMRDKGIRVKLTIVGCVPPDDINDADIEVIPRLNKNLESDYQRFIALFFTHHFLILPTRAECYGVVFAEASAFGLPCLTTDTGGIPSVVRNGLNGYRLPLSAPGSAYAALAARVFANFETEYLPMAFAARKFYEEELSHEVFGRRVREAAEYALARKKTSIK